jgi:uncharacterized RDD family membrane protein YckC
MRMNEDNPYAPPKIDLAGIDDAPPNAGLADRGTRFLSAFLDGCLGLCYGLPILYLVGYWPYLAATQEPPFSLTLAGSAISFVCFLVVHGYLLKTKGQTVGKLITGIRIADLDGYLPDFSKVILLRYLPISLAALIPVVGPYLSLVDVVFIFGSERRCVHDLLAGTKVVKVRKSR